MPRTASNASSLASQIGRLLAQREEHAKAMASIDKTLQEISRLVGSGGSARGASAGEMFSAGQASRKRNRYENTAEESILAFVKAQGNPTTKDIKRHWAREARRGTADNVLSRLVKAKRLKRNKLADARGSTYSVV